jgi:hypothetical protein
MPEVAADEVEPQAYINFGNDAFKVDFCIPRNHLVLEIDGFAKSGQIPTFVDLERRNRRDAALQAMGYTVLHFSNAQVQDEPKSCTVAIREAIARSAGTASPPSTPPPTPTTNSTVAAYVQVPGKPNRNLVVGIIGAGVVLAGLFTFAIITAQGNPTAGDTASTVVPASEGNKSEAVTQTAPLWVSPETKFDCPKDFAFKANDNGLVHPPDNKPYYARTTPERCYANLGYAEADGYSLPAKYDGEWSR